MPNANVNKVQLADGTVLIDLTSDTVTAEKMANGTVAHDKSGTQITGTLIPLAAQTINTDWNNRTLSAGYYLLGEIVIAGVTFDNVIPANVRHGVNLKVGDENNRGRLRDFVGTFTSSSTSTATEGAAGSAQILTGYSAWVDGEEVTGTMAIATEQETAEIISEYGVSE